ncbi:uncharacterized protein LOC134565526 [Prinia subflava]|uniref:uncharacterized protein LOC134565526 n=1 Tax=Prinia subflava TaxID=208062 RepID=UPI002FE3A38E
MVILGTPWCSGRCGGSSELLSGFWGFCHGIWGWMRLEGTIGVTQSHPLLVPSGTELRAGDRLGTGVDTTCAALEVAVKGVRDRQGWESLETLLECSRSPSGRVWIHRSHKAEKQKPFVHVNQKETFLHRNTNRLSQLLAQGEERRSPLLAAASDPGNFCLPGLKWNNSHVEHPEISSGGAAGMGLNLLLLNPGGRFPEGSETPECCPPGGSWVSPSLQEVTGMSPLSPCPAWELQFSAGRARAAPCWILFPLHHHGQTWLSPVPTAPGGLGDTQVPLLRCLQSALGSWGGRGKTLAASRSRSLPGSLDREFRLTPTPNTKSIFSLLSRFQVSHQNN